MWYCEAMTLHTDILNQISKDIVTAINYKQPVIDTDDAMTGVMDFLSSAIPSIAITGNESIDALIDDYLAKLFMQVRVLSSKAFLHNPYIQNIHFHDQIHGHYQLRNMTYEKGELFFYDFPYQTDGILIPRIGCFDKRVSFPSIYEGSMPWMSVIPSEIKTMSLPIQKACGNVLTLGLGLGYYPYMAALKDDVRSMTVVEKSADVIDLFKYCILNQFSREVKDKFQIIHEDAFQYMDSVTDGMYDVIFTDIYEGYEDGHQVYESMQKYQKTLVNTDIEYWIESYIH